MRSTPSAPLDALFRVLLFLMPAALVLPFDPHWFDFERARRTLLPFVVLVLGIGAARRRFALPRGPAGVFLLLPLLGLVSSLWAGDAGSAIERTTYWFALAFVVWAAPRGNGDRTALFAGIVTASVLTAIYGIAQALGLDWPQGFTSVHEPVGTLGNRNVAAEWTAMAAVVCLGIRPLFAIPCLAVLGLYLGVNAGRAALLGYGAAMLLFVAVRFLWVPRRQWCRTALGALALTVVLAPVLGAALLRPAPDPQPEKDGMQPSTTASVSTLEVRKKLYPAVLDLAVHELPLGAGSGNFEREFPPYRNAQEIAISMEGAGGNSTVVDTAHNDPLELFAELGLLGLVFVALLLWALLRALLSRRLPLLTAAVVLAFVPLTLARAPLANAPAAFVLCAVLGLSFRPRNVLTRSRESDWLGRASVLLGALLVAYAAYHPLRGQQFGARHVQKMHAEDRGVFAVHSLLADLDTAIRLDPVEMDWRIVRALRTWELLKGLPHLDSLATSITPEVRAAVEKLRERRPSIRIDVERILESRPFHYAGLYMMGIVGFEEPDLRERGHEAVRTLLRIHPGYPRANEVLDAHERLALAIRTIRNAELAIDSPELAAGYDAIRSLRKEHPRLRPLQLLEFEYAVRCLDASEIRLLTRLVVDPERILSRLEWLDQLEPGPKYPREKIDELRTKIRSAASELWPERREFR